MLDYKSPPKADSQLTLHNLWPVIKQVFDEWSEDKAPKMAAALAYYAIISIAPLLVVLLFVIGKIYSSADAVHQLHAQVARFADDRVATAVDAIVPRPGSSSGLVATIVSLIIALVGASGVFAELQDSLNTIWEVRPKPNRGWMAIVTDRLSLFGMVGAIAFLLLVTTILSSTITSLSTWITHAVLHADTAVAKFFTEVALDFVDFALSTAVITVLFATMFKWLPKVEIKWADVWFGALVTGFLFQLGKYGLSAYIKYGSAGSAYGAAGSLVALLIWIFYASQILFFGAEFTQVHANKFGSHIVPAPSAEPLTEAMREQAGIAHDDDSPSHPDNRSGPWQSEFARRRAFHLPLPITTPAKPRPAYGLGIAPLLIGIVLGRFAFKRYQASHRPAVALTDRWTTAVDKWKRLGKLFVIKRAQRFAMTHGPNGTAGPTWETLGEGRPK